MLPPGDNLGSASRVIQTEFAGRLPFNDISADGRTIVFQELGDATAGRNVVYVRPTDGSAAVRLGEGRFSTISPDGQTVVSAHLDGTAFILYPLGPEPPRTVPLTGFDVDAPHLHRDGRTIIFQGTDSPSHPERVWRTDVSGSKPLPVTPEGVTGALPLITPDGRHVVTRSEAGFALYPIGGGEPVPVTGIVAGERIAGWAADGRSVFTFVPGDRPLRVARVDLRSGRREAWREIVLADGVEAPTLLRLTPDGKSTVYFFWRFRSDLHLVEGLR